MLSKEKIEKFKRLYKKHFGIDLDDVEASRRANNLVNLYKAVYSGPSLGLGVKSSGEVSGENHEKNSG